MNFEHTPVLLKEVIEFLAPKSGDIYLDGTLGGGGYAEAILNASAPDGKVVGLDIDAVAIEAASVRLKKFGDRIAMLRESYSEVQSILEERGIKFDGVVLDLGVSSPQFDEAERGFSFSKNAPLDMRMDDRLELTAEEVVNRYSERELKSIFENYGDERFAARISRAIVQKRKEKRIETTLELEEICFRNYPLGLRKAKTHPATRVFQALRIEVNGELTNLQKFLEDAPKVLSEKGRMVIVSYHSLEDRFVKNVFKSLAMHGGFKLLTKKPVAPADEEVERNPRARSAKLRAIEKDGTD